MRRAPELHYDPGTKATVYTVARGVVDDVSETKRAISSESIVAPNRRARITVHDSVPDGGPRKLALTYHAPGYIELRAGGTYALALAGDVCAGVFETVGDEVLLPARVRTGFVTFAASTVGGPIPDFYGIHAPLES